MSDEGWLSFKGFRNAKVDRFWYIPGVKREAIVYN
jgi:hypothetical protein